MMNHNFKHFSQGKPCAVCKGTENVYSMVVTVNGEKLNAPVCTKPKCRGEARRNKDNNVLPLGSLGVMPDNYSHNKPDPLTKAITTHKKVPNIKMGDKVKHHVGKSVPNFGKRVSKKYTK